MVKYSRSFWIFFLLITSVGVMGQVQEDYFDPLTDDITDYLPPLEALLDSAVRNSPEVKYEQLKTDYYRYEVRSAQVAFLEHFYAEPEVNYGQYYFDDYITSRTTSAQASYPYTESNRWNFNFAFSIRFPLTSIVDRRNRINKQKKWVEISMAQQEINKRIIRQEVITLYNTIVQQQRQLKIHNDYQHFTNIQMMMAENEFVNGQISTAEITRLKEIQTRGATEFEKTRAEFENAYDLLQEKTGMRFNKIKGID